MGVKNVVFPNLPIVYDDLSKNSMAFIDHIPGDLNSVNKIIKIPTIPSAVLDTDKTNNKHVTQILSYSVPGDGN
jgi:hypothetical protein